MELVRVQPNNVDKVSDCSEGNKNCSVNTLPSILDGELFRVIEQNGLRITAKCCNCPGEKIILGTKTSTGNFLSHIKRVHPTLLEKAKNKRTRIGLRKWQEVHYSSQDSMPYFTVHNSNNTPQNEADNFMVNHRNNEVPVLSIEKLPCQTVIKELNEPIELPSQKCTNSRNSTPWKLADNKVRPYSRNHIELKKRLSDLKNEYFQIKQFLKNNKRNIEENSEQSVTDFSGVTNEGSTRNVEDCLEFEVGHMSCMIRNRTEEMPETTIGNNSMEENSFYGRDWNSPSTSTSQLSDSVFSSSSSSDEKTRNYYISKKSNQKQKTKEKLKNYKFFKAKKKSYELKKKKLQMEIEVTQSMKTLITSLAGLVNKIQTSPFAQSFIIPNQTVPCSCCIRQNPTTQSCTCDSHTSSSSSTQPSVVPTWTVPSYCSHQAASQQSSQACSCNDQNPSSCQCTGINRMKCRFSSSSSPEIVNHIQTNGDDGNI